MANTLTTIIDKILARGLSTLREQAVMPRLVNVDFNNEASQKGTTVDVPLPVSQSVSDVTPSNTPIAAASKTPGLVQIPMAQWKKTNFHLTDKEMVEVDRNRHFLPMQSGEAVKALANNIDVAIHTELGNRVYGYIGKAAVTTFSTVKTVTDARKTLNNQLAPMTERSFVIDPDSEGAALQLSAFSDLEKTGDRAVKIEGELGRKFGMDFFMSQNVQTHTSGSATAGDGLQVATEVAVGVSTILLKTSAGTSIFNLGDIFTFAGDSQTYVNKTLVTVTTASTTLSFDPALTTIASAGTIVTVKATHVMNLAFNRNACAYVTRPLQSSVGGDVLGGSVVRSLSDNMTGLVLRLEVSRQHKRTVWEFDVLYGTKTLRPEFGMRIAG